MSVFETRTCGCLGCRADAAAKMRHPEHGPRAVCPDHYLLGAEIIEFFGGDDDV